MITSLEIYIYSKEKFSCNIDVLESLACTCDDDDDDLVYFVPLYDVFSFPAVRLRFIYIEITSRRF